MKSFSSFLKLLLIVLVVAGAVVFVVTNWSFVFSKRITGKVVDVERVTDPSAVLGGRVTEAQMYSYSILIQGDDGHLYTSSSEDRQWQVVKKGYCVETVLYRYPPWELEKSGTFFNARLKDVRVCPGESELPKVESPQPSAPPPALSAPKPTEAPKTH